MALPLFNRNPRGDVTGELCLEPEGITPMRELEPALISIAGTQTGPAPSPRPAEGTRKARVMRLFKAVEQVQRLSYRLFDSGQTFAASPEEAARLMLKRLINSTPPACRWNRTDTGKITNGFQGNRDIRRPTQTDAALLQRYSQEGEKALAAGRYDEAAQAYEKLRELAPNTAEIHARLGLICFQQGKFEPAAPALRRAIKLKPTLPNSLWLHLAAGEANESQGRSDAAIQEYKEVLSLQPNRPGIHYRIGRALLARAKQSTDDAVSEAEALKEFERELLLDPTNANAAEQQKALAEFQRLRESKARPAESLSKREITKQTLDAKPNQ